MERMNTMIKHMKQRKASFRIKHALQYLEKLDDHEKLIDELRGEWMGFIAREIVKNIQEDEKGMFLEVNDLETSRLLEAYLEKLDEYWKKKRELHGGEGKEHDGCESPFSRCRTAE